uniref:tetratricopeptide repeat protein 29-like n=1 Tax=Vespula vulgaris TaxID=7454 RepID=UPI00223A72B3|nr:tetratricopeptide repeat protein 29-like [Vespula vulgaris]
MKNLTQAELHNVKKIRKDLKAMLPMIPFSEVKRYTPYRFHLKHNEAVIDELKEEGLEEAADFIKKLIDFNEEKRNIAGPGTSIWTKPRLMDQRDLLNNLKEALIAIENAKKMEQWTEASNFWIKISLFFQSQGPDWWWVTKTLYQNALKAAESVKEDKGYNITVARYLYGRFLFMIGYYGIFYLLNDNKKEIIIKISLAIFVTIEAEWLKALEYLDIAREASEEKIWKVTYTLDEKQKTIFKESCALIYKILIGLVQRIDEEDSEFAIQACNEALERAKDISNKNNYFIQSLIYFKLAGNYDYIANALYELGRAHLRYGYVKEALQEFSKLLAIVKRIPDPKGICNAHMELAFAYKEIDDTENTEKHLQLFRKNATQFNLPYKLAQAHYYTGEYLLNQMKPNLATSHLEKAFSLYYDLGYIEEADQARFITGISRGQEQINRFINLILECGEHNQYALLKMCNWKSNRDIFWTDKQRDIDTDYPHEYCEYFTYPVPSILNNSTKENLESQ